MVAIMASVTTRGAGEEGAVRLSRGDQVVVQAVGNLMEGAHVPHKNYQQLRHLRISLRNIVP